jgi:hypothetical protein
MYSLLNTVAHVEFAKTEQGKALITRSKAKAAELIFNLDTTDTLSSDAIYDAVLLTSSLCINLGGSELFLEPANENFYDKDAVLAQLQDAQSVIESALFESVLPFVVDTAERLPGATAMEILDVHMPDHVEYESVADCEEWQWVEKWASFSHVKNGSEEDPGWEHIVNLAFLDDVNPPAKLMQVFQDARAKDVSYVLFHH